MIAHIDWIGLGPKLIGLDWVGLRKFDPCPTLGPTTTEGKGGGRKNGAKGREGICRTN